MKSWSVPLAIEAALCAGLHTLCAPLLLFVVLAPMVWWGALVVLTLVAACGVALGLIGVRLQLNPFKSA